MKPLRRRELADRDLADAIDYYLLESTELAQRFVDSTEQAFRHIRQHPGTGSPRYAHELNLPGLRCWALRRFPYLVFYREVEEGIDIWRVLHAQRDIPNWLAESK